MEYRTGKPPPQVEKWGSASNEPLNFQSSVCLCMQVNGRRGAPVKVFEVLSYCGTIVRQYDKCQIIQGCVKAAECWIYQIIGFSRLNNQNRVPKIDKTRLFVILEITFCLWVFRKRPFKYCQVAVLLANYLDGPIRSFDGSFSYCLKRQMGEFSPLFSEDRYRLFQELWASFWCLVSKCFVLDSNHRQKIDVLHNGSSS